MIPLSSFANGFGRTLEDDEHLYSSVAHLPAGGGRAQDMYYVYALYNKKHGKIYIGQTCNLKKRLEEHLKHSFKCSFTSRYDGEWGLIYSESVAGRLEALQREKQLKSYRGREFVKNNIPL